MDHHPPPPLDHAARHPSAGRRRPVDVHAVALLRLAQAGDKDAFAQLYATYLPTVRRYLGARMRYRDRDAVPDLAQETFAAALEELDRAHEDVEGWLLQLAAKMCTRHAWAHRRYLRAALTTGEQQRNLTTSDPLPAPDTASEVMIAQALAGLQPRERLVLQLRFLDGQRLDTAARLLGCSVWTVRHRQRLALRQLAAALRGR